MTSSDTFTKRSEDVLEVGSCLLWKEEQKRRMAQKIRVTDEDRVRRERRME